MVLFCASEVPGEGAEEAVSVAGNAEGAEEAVSVAGNADTPVWCDFSAAQLVVRVGIGEAVDDWCFRVCREDLDTSPLPVVRR